MPNGAEVEVTIAVTDAGSVTEKVETDPYGAETVSKDIVGTDGSTTV
jgi:hypothetical protein